MKQEIINFVTETLLHHRIHDWDYESAKSFCKLIFDGEGIDYQDDDFKSVGFSNTAKETKELVKRYAKMYYDFYTNSDPKKANEMGQVLFECNQMLKFESNLDNIFSGRFSGRKEDEESTQEINIKKGKSITFSNGAASELNPNELENLMRLTWPEEPYGKPFTISFSSFVPDDIQVEIMNRISDIYEEVSAEIERRKAR